MSDWTTDLADEIKLALARGEPQTITVDTDDTAELGQIAARRLARNMGRSAAHLTFVVTPRTDQ